jgi:chorismate mutase
MIKNNKDDSLFVYLDWILKKKSKGNGDQTPISPFILNRWLSMADNNIAQMVNATTNRWLLTKNQNMSDPNFIGSFFRTILPKFTKRISYIKKIAKEKTTEDYLNIANSMQCSTKEIEMYEKTLAEIRHTLK